MGLVISAEALHHFYLQRFFKGADVLEMSAQ